MLKARSKQGSDPDANGAKGKGVLLLGPYPPPIAGIERYCQDIMLSELKERCGIVLFKLNIPEAFRPRATTERYTWNIVRRDGLFGAARVLGFATKRLWDYSKLLKRNDFAIMHVLSTAGYGFFRNAIHVGLAKRRGIKTIFHHLGQIDDLYNQAGSRTKRLITRCLSQADVHVVQSPGLATFLRGLTSRPVYSIFNGVRTEELAPPNGFARSDGNMIAVVALGRLGHKKGTFDLLEVARRLRDSHPKIRFDFIGGGEVDRFRKIAREDGLYNVAILGALSDEDRIKQLQTSDIFALPSHAEGQPIALLEAMAAGLPLISSTVGSIPEVVKKDNGFLVTPGDIDSITNYIVMLANDAELRATMGLHNSSDAQKRYSLARTLREIEELYKNTLGN